MGGEHTNHAPIAGQIVDLQRVMNELLEEIKEDNDWHGRDHTTNGRWSMVHRISAMIAVLRKEVDNADH